jgi:hypothetical protein
MSAQQGWRLDALWRWWWNFAGNGRAASLSARGGQRVALTLQQNEPGLHQRRQRPGVVIVPLLLACVGTLVGSMPPLARPPVQAVGLLRERGLGSTASCPTRQQL